MLSGLHGLCPPSGGILGSSQLPAPALRVVVQLEHDTTTIFSTKVQGGNSVSRHIGDVILFFYHPELGLPCLTRPANNQEPSQ